GTSKGTGTSRVKTRYCQGVAADRPYVYWVWANYAALLCAVGLAPAAAVTACCHCRNCAP
ncbi:MAG: hypothetical protein M3O32_20055, partial [Actinomycetota bacterium]|nr:hypothetical protein [Actinomycetota bacterium]